MFYTIEECRLALTPGERNLIIVSVRDVSRLTPQDLRMQILKFKQDYRALYQRYERSGEAFCFFFDLTVAHIPNAHIVFSMKELTEELIEKTRRFVVGTAIVFPDSMDTFVNLVRSHFRNATMLNPRKFFVKKDIEVARNWVVKRLETTENRHRSEEEIEALSATEQREAVVHS